jgi:hypothetical protein
MACIFLLIPRRGHPKKTPPLRRVQTNHLARRLLYPSPARKRKNDGRRPPRRRETQRPRPRSTIRNEKSCIRLLIPARAARRRFISTRDDRRQQIDQPTGRNRVRAERPPSPFGVRRGSLRPLRERRVVVPPVYFQPVSAVNSLLAGKIQGKYRTHDLIPVCNDRVVPRSQRLIRKYPGHLNRENRSRNREDSRRE